jgi:sulfhydrogenase subunit beta (sulfur reductase)
VFSKISEAQDIAFDYETTILPPKKIFFPPRENIFTFSKEDDSIKIKQEELDSRKVALIGVKPCDVNALLILDEVMKKDYPDT